MSATEIPNLLDTQVSFTAADPPVIISRSANVAGVSRSNAGQYTIDLVQKIPTGGLFAAGTQLICSHALASAGSFADAIEDGTGDVLVQTRAIGGALADTTARVDVAILRYPTTG